MTPWFHNREVLKAVGTGEQHYKWMSECCASGLFVCAMRGLGPTPSESVVPAHVRRIKWGSGVGRKGDYNIIPLLDSVHRVTHGSVKTSDGRVAGERAALMVFKSIIWAGKPKEEVSEWYESRAEFYAGMWAREVLSRLLQIDLVTKEVDAEAIAALDGWAAEHNIMLYSEAQTCKT